MIPEFPATLLVFLTLLRFHTVRPLIVGPKLPTQSPRRTTSCFDMKHPVSLVRSHPNLVRATFANASEDGYQII